METFILVFIVQRTFHGWWVSVQTWKVETEPPCNYWALLTLPGNSQSVIFPMVTIGRPYVVLLRLLDHMAAAWQCQPSCCFETFQSTDESVGSFGAFRFFSLRFPLCLIISLCLCLFVPLPLSLYLPLSIHLVSCAREILTDPLEELRDSISRQQNGTVVLGNSVALERWVLKEE